MLDCLVLIMIAEGVFTSVCNVPLENNFITVVYEYSIQSMGNKLPTPIFFYLCFFFLPVNRYFSKISTQFNSFVTEYHNLMKNNNEVQNRCTV